MPSPPFPITGEEETDIKRQVWELIRELYEERIAGLLIGDVFQDSGDVLTLKISPTGGLEKSSNYLQVKKKSDGGLASVADGLYVKCKTDGHLDRDENGLYTTMTVQRGGRAGQIGRAHV